MFGIPMASEACLSVIQCFEWTVVTIDFAGIFLRVCQDSDYYDWRPWDEVGLCVLWI